MITHLFITCWHCGCRIPLPNDRTIKPIGVLALPLHKKQEHEAAHEPDQFEPVETLEDPECCFGSEKLALIETRSAPRFAIGQHVRIFRLDDNFTSESIIGHTGHIEEVDSLPNGDFNYFMKCTTCSGSHYIHEPELQPA